MAIVIGGVAFTAWELAMLAAGAVTLLFLANPETQRQQREAARQIERALRRARRPQPEWTTGPTPIPSPRVCEDCDDDDRDSDECLVGPYEEIEPVCTGDAHHIVPDMAYRLGRRPRPGPDRRSTTNRVPNAPTFNRGMSICLTPSQHGSGPTGIHGQLRGALRNLPSDVAGTASMGSIYATSIAVLSAVPDLPEACKALAAAMTGAQVTSHTGINAPGRTLESPLPSGEARTVLQRGYY